MAWGYKGTPDPLEFNRSGVMALSAPAVAIVMSVALSGAASLSLHADRIVVPKTGSIDFTLSGAPTLGLDGHAGFSDAVTTSGSGQLVWTPVAVNGGGMVQLRGLGRLKFDDPNGTPILVWNGEIWRQANASVWNGRAWLPIRANRIHVF